MSVAESAVLSRHTFDAWRREGVEGFGWPRCFSEAVRRQGLGWWLRVNPLWCNCHCNPRLARVAGERGVATVVCLFTACELGPEVVDGKEAQG